MYVDYSAIVFRSQFLQSCDDSLLLYEIICICNRLLCCLLYVDFGLNCFFSDLRLVLTDVPISINTGTASEAVGKAPSEAMEQAVAHCDKHNPEDNVGRPEILKVKVHVGQQAGAARFGSAGNTNRGDGDLRLDMVASPGQRRELR